MPHRLPLVAALALAVACAPRIPEGQTCETPPTLAVAEGALAPLSPHEARLVDVSVQSICPGERALEVELTGDPPFQLEHTPDAVVGTAVVRLSLTAETVGTYAATLSAHTGGEGATLALEALVTLDADADGYDSDQFGGRDCDDADPDTYPGAAERDDGRDNDCDGLIDEDFVLPGDIVVTEVFARPSGGDLRRSLWVEVYNDSDTTRHLDGWTVALGASQLDVAGPLPIEPGEYAVLGVEPDLQASLGVPVDARLDITIAPTPGWRGVVLTGGHPVFEAAGLTDAGFMPGRSLGLVADEDPDLPTAWCPATSRLSNGDRGTPGHPNDVCNRHELDQDGDGFTPTEGDCDDSDPTVHPGADERWNRKDDDCDGSTDLLVIDEFDTVALDEWIGRPSAVAGDLDGEGTVEVAIYMDSAERTRLYAESALLGGAPSHTAEIQGDRDSGLERHALPLSLSDLDGDGLDDLVIVAERETSAAVFTGRPSGSVTADDAYFLMGQGEWPERRTNAFGVGDTTGDGVAELIFARPEGAAIFDIAGLSGVSTPDDVGSVPVAGPYVAEIGASDTDDDGHPDLVALANQQHEDGVFSYDVRVSQGDSSGRFALDAPDLRIQVEGRIAPFSRWHPPVDLDGDGVPDVAVPMNDPDQVIVFSLDQSGVLDRSDASITLDVPVASNYTQLHLVDIDADGQSDLASLLATHPEEGGAFWFAYGPLPAGRHDLADIATGRVDSGGWPELVDLDGDGDQDLLYRLGFGGDDGMVLHVQAYGE